MTDKDRMNRRTLFVRHMAFGDVLLTTPFFRQVMSKDPNAVIDLYSQYGNIYEPGKGFGQWIPLEEATLLKVLETDYSKIYWFNYEFNRSLHILDAYALTSGIAITDKTLSWTIRPEELHRTRALLEGIPRPIVGFHPLCGNPLKSLSMQKSQRIVDAIRKGLGATVAVFGDRPLGIERCLDLSGRFDSIRDLGAVISQCDVWLSIDTGPFHIAQALKVPTVGLFGPTLPELLVTQPSSLHCVRMESLPCLGCYHRVPKGQESPSPCERGDIACMEELSEPAILQALTNALEMRPDKVLARRIETYESFLKDYLSSGPEDPQVGIEMLKRRIEEWHRHLAHQRKRNSGFRKFRRDLRTLLGFG